MTEMLVNVLTLKGGSDNLPVEDDMKIVPGSKEDSSIAQRKAVIKNKIRAVGKMEEGMVLLCIQVRKITEGRGGGGGGEMEENIHIFMTSTITILPSWF